jgi:hypothetical protein
VTSAVGAVAVLCGLLIAVNALGVADSLARINRSFPWWMKSPVADYPVASRITGGAIAVFGVALIILSVRGGG